MGSIGPFEIILILIVALLVFGPRRLPEIGRSVGKGMREFRKASSELREEFERVGDVDLEEPPSPVPPAAPPPDSAPAEDPATEVAAPKPRSKARSAKPAGARPAKRPARAKPAGAKPAARGRGRKS